MLVSLLRILGFFAAMASLGALLLLVGRGWDENPVQAALGSMAAILAGGFSIALMRWMSARGPAHPPPVRAVHLPNVVWPSLALGACLWLGLKVYEWRRPVSVPPDVGLRLKTQLCEKLSSQIQAKQATSKLFREVPADQLPPETVVIDRDDPPEKRREQVEKALYGHGTLAFSGHDLQELRESQRVEARSLIAQALRCGRRDPDLCELVVRYAQLQDVPEEELRALQLLHHTHPPRPQPEREKALMDRLLKPAPGR